MFPSWNSKGKGWWGGEETARGAAREVGGMGALCLRDFFKYEEYAPSLRCILLPIVSD